MSNSVFINDNKGNVQALLSKVIQKYFRLYNILIIHFKLCSDKVLPITLVNTRTSTSVD